MATVYKVLGQSNPAATTLTSLYTVPALTSTVISTITVANISTGALTYRIAVRPAGAAIANQHDVAYDAALPANSTTTITLGITLATTDVISVYGPLAGGREARVGRRPVHTVCLVYCVLTDSALVALVSRGYYRGRGSPLISPTGGRFFMKRRPVSKYKSAGKFRKAVGKTAKKNLAQPGRGGFRI